MDKLHSMTLLQRVVVVLGLAGCSLTAHAQVVSKPSTVTVNSTSVFLTPAQTANFQRSLYLLSDQAHIAIVAEGMPLKPRLNTKAAPVLMQGVAAASAIAALAAAYDYDVQRVGGVFVLTKRYSNPHDLPCVTLAECSQSVKFIVALLGSFSPHFAQSVFMDGPDGEKDAIVQFFASLSPPQLAAAQARTLRYGNLSPDQKSLVTSLFLFPLIQMPSNRIMETGGYLESASKGTITLRAEQNYPGLFLMLPGSSADAAPIYVSLVDGVTFPEGQDTASAALLPMASTLPDSPPPATLGSVVASLGPIDGQKPVAASSISGKPVSAFGLKYARPKDVMTALAALYGLRNGASPSGSPQLEPSFVPAPLELKQLKVALWSAVPTSYNRVIHIRMIDGEIVYSNPSPDALPPAGMPAAEAKKYVAFQNSLMEMNSNTLSGEIKSEAARRLLAALRPQIKKAGSKAHILVSSLDDSARSDLAILLMSDLVGELQHGFSGQGKESVMDCLDNMDQTIIYTDPNTAAHVYGQVVPSFDLVGTDPYTNQQIGLGGVQYGSHEYSDLDPKPAK